MSTHATRLDVHDTADGFQYRPVCACLWRGKVHDDPDVAEAVAAAHVAVAHVEGN